MTYGHPIRKIPQKTDFIYSNEAMICRKMENLESNHNGEVDFEDDRICRNSKMYLFD